MRERRRVLLLGATGFIGRHARAAFETAGDEVLAIGGPGARESTSRGLDLAEGDLAALVAEAGTDVVVNCAGRTHGTLPELEAANVTLVRRLLDAVARSSVRLVHLGSAAEYGPSGGVRPTREDDPARPDAQYGRTKLRATELVRASGLDAIVLRVFNPVGAGMRPESMPGSAAHRIFEALALGADAITMGDLSAQRDFVDARDVGEAIVAVARAAAPPSLINVGSGRAVPSRTLVAELADVAGFRGAIREDGAASPRSATVDYQCAAVEVARKHLGWAAHRSLRESVTELWKATASVGS